MKTVFVFLSLSSLLVSLPLATALASIPPPSSSSLSTSSSSSSSSSNDYFAPPSATGGMAPMTIKENPMAPLGKKWTSEMDRKVNHGSETAAASPIKFYGEDNQANGKGGRSPLGKEWTSAMDMKASKTKEQELHIKPFGLDHQANGHGGRSPLGKVSLKMKEIIYYYILYPILLLPCLAFSNNFISSSHLLLLILRRNGPQPWTPSQESRDSESSRETATMLPTPKIVPILDPCLRNLHGKFD
jgi:hypothetical protein